MLLTARSWLALLFSEHTKYMLSRLWRVLAVYIDAAPWTTDHWACLPLSSSRSSHFSKLSLSPWGSSPVKGESAGRLCIATACACAVSILVCACINCTNPCWPSLASRLEAASVFWNGSSLLEIKDINGGGPTSCVSTLSPALGGSVCSNSGHG